MKRCPKCGTYNPDTETRCTSCDAKLPENTVQPITAKATTTPKRCPVCGFVNEPGVHRCVKCDARIDGSRPPAIKISPKSSAPSLICNGLNNESISVRGDIVIIRKTSAFGRMRQKELHVTDIAAVMLEAPRKLHLGYMRFQVVGQKTNSADLYSGVSEAHTDENAIVFRDDFSYFNAAKIRDYISDRKANISNPSACTPNISSVSGADEILKYKQLLDAGIISMDEFNAAKKKILGI